VGELPELLTVEEAADLLRVGRTKAYAMTQEWRRTNGVSGLPVVDLGNALRVVRSELERRLGTKLGRNEQPDAEAIAK
jgi:excisionase family DNA binding protein